MEFVPASNVMQTAIVGTLAGQPVVNTLYVQAPASWTSASWAVHRDNVLILLNGLRAAQSQDFAWTRIEGTDLSSQVAPTYSHVIAGGLAGQVASPALPNNVAFCISFRTAGRGRSSRGRNYIAGLAESQVTANTLATNFITALIDSYLTFSTACEADGFTWVVLSRFHEGQPRAAGLVQPVAAVVATDSNTDSQRRRLPGRGPAG